MLAMKLGNSSLAGSWCRRNSCGKASHGFGSGFIWGRDMKKPAEETWRWDGRTAMEAYVKHAALGRLHTGVPLLHGEKRGR